MVARDRFKHRFKLSELRPDSALFLENMLEMDLKGDFNSRRVLKTSGWLESSVSSAFRAKQSSFI
jgi:hypothetical protein